MRFTTFLVSAGFALGLCACATKKDNRDLREIRDSGILRWGSDEAGGAPYEFRDPKDPSKRVGFEVEIADELAKRLNLKIEFVQNDFAQLIAALERGDSDMAMAGLEITEDRKNVVNFTRPYYIYQQQLLARADDKSISSLGDCNGKRVGTLNNTAAERILKATPGVEVVSYSETVPIFDDLAIGRTNAVLIDLPIATFYGKPRKELRFAGEPCCDGSYAIAIRKTGKGLQRALNQALEEMLKDGTLKRILEKWSLWNAAQAKL